MNRNFTGRGLQVAALLGAILGFTGCGTPPKPTNQRRGELTGVIERKHFDVHPCFEAVAPVAEELEGFNRAIHAAQTSNTYEADRAIRPLVVIDAPRRFTFTYAAFDGMPLPVVTLAYFKRRHRLMARQYQVTTHWTDATDRLTVESFTTYQYPEARTDTGDDLPVTFEVMELKDTHGALARGLGHLNKAGMIELDLRPFINAGAASARGLTFVLETAKGKLACEVVVKQEAFTRLQGDLSP